LHNIRWKLLNIKFSNLLKQKLLIIEYFKFENTNKVNMMKYLTTLINTILLS